jgi:hypothetical protein
MTECDYIDNTDWVFQIKNNRITTLILICSNDYYEIDKYKDILEALKTNTSVVLLSITYNYTILSNGYDEWSSILCEVLKINTTLSVIQLDIRNITNTSIKYLYEGLSTNTSIKQVTISFYNKIINDNHIMLSQLSNMLKTNTYITDICLYFEAINSESWTNITDSLKINNTLKKFKLHIRETNFNGSTQLNELLLVNKTMNHFELNTNNMIKYIDVIDVLERNSCVTYFSEWTDGNVIRDKIRCYVMRNRHNNKLKSSMLQDL